MPDKHISAQFDSELNSVSSRVMELGGQVESQIHQAIYALSQFSGDAAQQVLQIEEKVNAMEIEIDRDLSSIIARRQPTARDLRLLIAISKATANLERAGDEAEKIARMVRAIAQSGMARAVPSSELRLVADLASALLRKSLVLQAQRALLEPWFGPDLPLDALPLPRLVEVTEAPEGYDSEGLRQRLLAEARARHHDETRGALGVGQGFVTSIGGLAMGTS